MAWSVEQCKDYFIKYSSPNEQLSADGIRRMTLVHFSAFLISANNALLPKQHLTVHQNMNLPLNNYFICSSHNTYLLGDQLKSESSTEGYIRALQRGCKCVELDCHDGPNGLPIIYHGGTLTSKVLFKHVIEVIKKYAFVCSPYPVILSLETHCSLEQQEVMASILRDVIGDQLAFPEDVRLTENEHLPSPNALMYKIIIKVCF